MAQSHSSIALHRCVDGNMSSKEIFTDMMTCFFVSE